MRDRDRSARLETLLDLHSHTTASDGALSPEELVALAHRHGVRTLAITDHDTIAALPAARAAAEKIGLEIIGGVELSATHEDGRSVHILAYLFDEDDPRLLAAIDRLGTGRDARNARIAQRLTELGMPITLAEVEVVAKGRVGRPHFARLMIEKGYVATFDEAFDRWLADGRPANSERFVLSPQEAIEIVHAAGGIAVLAHPLSYGRSPYQADALLARAAKEGIDAVEVYYSNHTPGEVTMLESLASRYGLLRSGGGDFHVLPWPDQPRIPLSLLEPLKKRAERWKQLRT